MLCYIRFFTLFCYWCLFSIVIIILFLFLFLIFYNFSSCVSKRRWSYIEFAAISYICVVLFVFIIVWLLLSFQRDFPSWNFRVKINSFLSFFFFQETLIWKHIVNFILLIFMTLRTVFICYLAFIVQSA